MNLLKKLFNSRFFALAIKEIHQIFRDRQLIVFLIIPPTVQLLLYGFALNPDVQNLSVGIVDYAQTYESRELIAAITENDIFIPEKYFLNEKQLGQQVQEGKLNIGLIIPPDFNRKLSQNKPAEVQIFIDGVDANSAGIASGYLNQIIQQYNRRLSGANSKLLINSHSIFLYNPGLKSSWFFIPGMIGVILTLISSLMSAGTVIREKDTGTLEQLLMTPAEAWEILLAKMVPLFFLLMGDVSLALFIGRVVFNVPLRGNLGLFFILSGIYLLGGMSIGIMLATLARNQQQAYLMSFFINLPIIQLSGAIAPVESMPEFFRYIAQINPLSHYVAILRAILLRGVGLESLWQHSLAMLIFTLIMLLISINRFRRQLS